MNSSTLNRLALLICTFIMIGLNYKILDFYFLGLTYIIVYVGAISILFLFVIMITDTGKTPMSPLSSSRLYNKESKFIYLSILLL
jgi:NADH:ubiquinone oxidoreductase subunit 6 (subunit J)